MSLALNLHFARQFFNDCIFHSQHYSVCLKYFRNDFLSVMILSMWQIGFSLLNLVIKVTKLVVKDL